jgi:hypothetical protein
MPVIFKNGTNNKFVYAFKIKIENRDLQEININFNK